MNEADKTRLVRLLQSFDEAGLIALANKGLVRRAQKDLEAGGLTLEETETAVLVHGPGWIVTMPAQGPTHATDTTKATGVTRQILTATLFLRDHWASTPPLQTPGEKSKENPASPPSPEAQATPSSLDLEQTLLAISLEDLQKWAGKTVFREALALVSETPQIEIEHHAGLTIRLVQHEVEARLFASEGDQKPKRLLDAVLTTAPRAQHQRWVTVAVLALFRQHGRGIDSPDEAIPEDTGAPRSRPQVLASTQTLLESMVATGLAQPSERLRQRLLTLSISATAVHLPRLARLVRALADEVGLLLNRHAAADSGRLFERLTFTHALALALTAAGEPPPVRLAGRHRTQYDPVGNLPLAGIAAFPWQTASGFTGLTVLFWDLGGKCFRTWSWSRPSTGSGPINLRQTYRTETVWSGGSPENFSRTLFVLQQARANPQGRLSGSSHSTVVDLAPLDPGQLDLGERSFSEWSRLWPYLQAITPLGLIEKDPLDQVVILKPTHWGERVFDELQQCFLWPIHDGIGQPLILTLPWAGIHEASIEFLEAVKPGRENLTHAVVRIVFGPRGPSFQPLALWSAGSSGEGAILNPAFDLPRIKSRQSSLLDKLRKKFGRDRIVTTMTPDEDEEDQPGIAYAGGPPGLTRALAEVENWLLRLAESGLGRRDANLQERARQLAANLHRRGLEELARGLEELSREEAGPPALLAASYRANLCRQALAIPFQG